tara:strand:- start:222 stop:671 length:450 start_codon:yes stop_codon:yes gene_type:complete
MVNTRKAAKFISVLTLIVLTIQSVPSYAAISWVSRANCGIALPGIPFLPPVGYFLNESITWNQFDGNDYWMQTGSVHNQGGYAAADGSNWIDMHAPTDPWAYGWRSYAGDSHALSIWFVHGVHYSYDDFWGITYFLGYTFATHCNITQW